MKKWILIILMVLMCSFVMADQGEIEVYKPNEVFDLSVHLTDFQGEVSGATCNIQIQSNNYTTLINQQMLETTGGWYNFTYNTSQIGKYFCDYNCTKGSNFASDTCDFIIEGDENLALAIVITLLVIIILYFLLVRYFTVEMFVEHGGIKMMLMLGGFWLLLVPLAIVTRFNEYSGGPANIEPILNSVYMFMMVANVLISFYFIIWFIWSMVKKMQSSSRTGEDSE